MLHMSYYTLSEPQACKDALLAYKEFNDPVRQFAEEMLPLCKWDLLPFSFLYDLYKSWFKKNSPSGSLQGKSTFITDLMNLLPSLPEWSCQGKTKAIKPAKRMSEPEPLILQYNLNDWKNPAYRGTDEDKICTPMLKNTYNGLIRVPVAITPSDFESETETEEP